MTRSPQSRQSHAAAEPFVSHIARHALAILPLSLVGGVLFFAAQASASPGPTDHRHIDAWLLWTALLVITWLGSAILEYNRRRGRALRF